MDRSYRHIVVNPVEDVFCVALKDTRLDEAEVYEWADEVLSLLNDRGCRKLVLALGPDSPDCLYSVFIAKILMLRRRIVEQGGIMKLCSVSPHVKSVFEACQLTNYFDFHPDRESALASLGEQVAKS
ncbi:MAG: STAS domain-containing protein [Gemmataceae bacterium]